MDLSTVSKQNVASIEKTISELEKEVNKKREGWEKVQLQDGQFVSNCKNCNVTCISSKCYTSWFWKPKCLRCPAKCGSDSHSAENYRWKSILLPVDKSRKLPSNWKYSAIPYKKLMIMLFNWRRLLKDSKKTFKRKKIL